jgi:hypothetical protein
MFQSSWTFCKLLVIDLCPTLPVVHFWFVVALENEPLKFILQVCLVLEVAMAEEDAKRRWGGLQLVYEEIVKDDLQQSVDAERTEVKIVTAPHRTAGLQKEGLFRENFARIRWWA